MLIILPVIFLFIAALVTTIINQTKPNIAVTWLIGAGSCFISWLIIIIMRLYLPSTLFLIKWEPEFLFFGSPMLVLDYQSWPYALCLITLTLAAILTDSARTRLDSSPRTWVNCMVITAINLLALMAGNPLTMVLAWTFVDLIELIYKLSWQRSGKFNQRIILSYGVRLLSVIMFIWATMVGWLENGPFDLNHIPARAAVYFLIAAGLRLGVLPLNLAFLNEPGSKRGAGSLLRLAPVASSLILLAHLPENTISIRPYWSLPLQAMTALAALYGAGMWAAKQDAIEGRPYWIVALASLSIACVINGQPASSRAWGVALLLTGSMLFLFSPRIRRMRFLLFLGLLGILAMPFTPAASGWQGLISQGLNLWSVSLILSHTLLILGYMRHIFSVREAATGLDAWAKVMYPLGLIIIIQADIAIGLIGWPGVLTHGFWWGGLISFLIVTIVTIFVWRLDLTPPYINLPEEGPIGKLIGKSLGFTKKALSLEWAYKLVWSAYQLLGQLIFGLVTILEGDGGILWALLLLVLLISLITSLGVS